MLQFLATKPQILVLSGLPASGKSTLAREWVAEDPDGRIRINWDDMRLARYGPDWRFNRKEENLMKEASYEMAVKALKSGLSVVVDNTNLTPKARQVWGDIAADIGADYVEQELDTDVATCIARDRLRTGRDRVGRAVIERMALFHGFIDWGKYHGQFVICDIDGTLSDPAHRLHFVKDQKCVSLGPTSTTMCSQKTPGCMVSHRKDWDAFHDEVGKDALKEPIAKLLGHFRTLGYHIIICSGRWIGDKCGKDTEEWLERHGIQYDHLFMRQTHDSRADFVIKEEILELLPKDKIAYVLDDRDQVVKMWRRNGLTCLQVSKGDF